VYMKKSSKFRHTVPAILLCVLFVCIFSVFCTVSAQGSDSDIIVSLQIDDPIMEVNGYETEIDAGRGTVPLITDGRTLVPIRAIIEAFGGNVHWEERTSTVTLTMAEDTVRLIINSPVAYCNARAETLDVEPRVINGRTMLPIRFVAESFNLGVAWDGNTRTVTIIQNGFNAEEYNALMRELPPYEGQAYTTLNGNQPYFKDYEIISGSFEYYSTLDNLGRCDVCFASVAEDLMPTGERESISSVTPTGWINAAYDVVSGGYLYNRCHLIGFQLTGENANERNLITGTRYLNIEGMLPFENSIKEYIDKTGNHVMYRVTPVFTEDNMLADGVLLEAYSVEDDGQGISFCVYCYNVQPMITIDYATGASSPSGQTLSTPEYTQTEKTDVYRTPTGKRYHFDAGCGGENSYKISVVEAMNIGLTPCSKCAV